MKARLVCDALKMAIWQMPTAGWLIVHSDRGSQYASKEYRRLLKSYGFIGSMSRLGNFVGTIQSLKPFLATLNKNSASSNTTKPAVRRSKMYCSILLCFITALGCIHTRDTKAPINMKQRQQK
jgi:transposase InsO family protein